MISLSFPLPLPLPLPTSATELLVQAIQREILTTNVVSINTGCYVVVVFVE